MAAETMMILTTLFRFPMVDWERNQLNHGVTGCCDREEKRDWNEVCRQQSWIHNRYF